MVKKPPANAGDTGPIPGLGRSRVEGNDYPLQRSRLEILWTEEADGLQSMRSQKSWTQLSNSTTTTRTWGRGVLNQSTPGVHRRSKEEGLRFCELLLEISG